MKFYDGKQASLKAWAEENGVGIYVLFAMAKALAEGIDFTTGQPLR